MDTNATYLLRWRGRQEGPFTLAQIERKLAENEIGMLHEIQLQGEWIKLREFLEQVEAERRAEAERAAAGLARASAQSGTTGEPQPRPQFQESADSSVSERDYILDIGTLIERAWGLVTKNLAGTIVSILLFALIMVSAFGLFGAVRAVALVLSAVVHPVVYIFALVFFGIISLMVNALVFGPLYGGLWYAYIGLARGEARGIADLFSGFRRKMGELMLAWIMPLFLTLLVAVLGLVPIVILAIMGVGLAAVRAPEAALQKLGRFSIVLMVVYLLCLYLPMMLLVWARWFYVLPLVVDKQIGCWAAMGVSWRRVGLHQWRFLLLWLLAGLIYGAGSLLCGVGIFFTWPLYLMVMAVAYTFIFDTEEPSGLG